MRFKKLFGVMLAIMVGTSMAVLAETASYVLTGPTVVPNVWDTSITILNRGAVQANCNLKVFGCATGTQRGLTVNFTIPAYGGATQSISQASPTVLTNESAVVSCDQPVDVWSAISTPAVGAQGVVKAVSAGLDYNQSFSVQGAKAIGEGGVTLNNTSLFVYNPTPNTETVTFTAKNAAGVALPGGNPAVPIVAKGCMYLPINDPSLFGANVPDGYRGAITMDTGGNGAIIASAATMDFGNGQFVYVTTEPLWGK